MPETRSKSTTADMEAMAASKVVDTLTAMQDSMAKVNE
jgi:hypothetical protein